MLKSHATSNKLRRCKGETVTMRRRGGDESRPKRDGNETKTEAQQRHEAEVEEAETQQKAKTQQTRRREKTNRSACGDHRHAHDKEEALIKPL